ncbi:MAG: hypothetical protein LBI39_01550 [Puniceicoccales bacterium]|jgi:tetrahydromethanopterin S-methyltransferase subunit D|nr:hypothetical protein [Puniceicoccales bacterium]
MVYAKRFLLPLALCLCSSCCRREKFFGYADGRTVAVCAQEMGRLGAIFANKMERVRAGAALFSMESGGCGADVLSPCDGVVGNIFFVEGETVPPSVPVVELGATNLVCLRFFVGRRAVKKLHLGQIVYASADGCAPVAAKINFIGDGQDAVTAGPRPNWRVHAVGAVPVDDNGPMVAGKPIAVSLDGRR